MRSRLALGLASIGFGLAIASLAEAAFAGRGVISIYLGPLSALAVFASLLVRDPARRIYWAGFIIVAIGYLVVIALHVASRV